MISRFEKLVTALLNGESLDDFKPLSRIEACLINCCRKTGRDGLPKPQSRAEVLLQALAGQLADSSGTEGLAYTLSTDGTHYICSGIGTATDTDIVIPSNYEGLPVSVIGAQAFEGNTTITNVIIPNSINKIDYDAFSGCTALTNISIPDRVTEISWYVFNECTALTNATIGRGVTNIGDYAFKGCINLKNVTFANDGANLNYMGTGVFNGCRSLSTFNIPKGLTGLLSGTLSANGGNKGGVTYQGFTDIVIPANIKTLADRAIYGCKSLTKVTFEGTPDRINPTLFEGCDQLTDIYVPWTVGTFAEAESAWQAAGKTIHYKPSAEVEEAYKRRELGFWFFTKDDQYYYEDSTDDGEMEIFATGVRDSITVPPQVQDGSATSFDDLFSAYAGYHYWGEEYFELDGIWAKEICGVINCANVTSVNALFAACSYTEKICDIINTVNVSNFGLMFHACAALVSIPTLDIRNATNVYGIFGGCTKLKNVSIKNIKLALQVGSGTYYGHELTVDSLVGLCYELIDTGSVKVLTVGNVNLEKLANVYVKQIEVTDEMRATDEFVDSKMPFVVCESTDEGATLISKYVQFKHWSLK